MPRISIVICTYNRAESLGETLATLRSLSGGNSIPHEVVVVDNNSSDKTRAVVESFAGTYSSPVKYIFEPTQGVSFARNTGIKNSHGDIIAFLDDDVLADPGWLAGLWKCFQETDADAVGGRVTRKWNCQKPDWYTEEIGGCLISQEFGEERKRWDNPRKHLVTANIAFHRRVFKKYGAFREELGRRGNCLLGGEDRELYQRLIENGGKVFYEPKALAFHKVERDRLTQPYFRQWFLEIGKTLGHEMVWKPAAAPLWAWGNYVQSCLRFLRNSLFRAAPGETFASELWVLYYVGMISERFVHWLPFTEKACAFKEHRKQDYEYNQNIS